MSGGQIYPPYTGPPYLLAPSSEFAWLSVAAATEAATLSAALPAGDTDSTSPTLASNRSISVFFEEDGAAVFFDEDAAVLFDEEGLYGMRKAWDAQSVGPANSLDWACLCRSA